MHDLDHREQAQLGLKYIEDAVVNLLTRHPKGLSGAAIADCPFVAITVAVCRRAKR